MKIANKISISFFITACILTSAGASIFYLSAKNSLQDSISNNLTMAVASRADHIETYLDTLKIFVGQLSKSTVLESVLKVNGKEGAGPTSAFDAALKRLKRTKEANPIIAEFLLTDKTGRVVVSSNESSIGIDRSSDSFFLGGQKATHIKDIYYSDIYKDCLMAISTPFVDSQTGEFLGVLAARVRVKYLNKIVGEKVGMGDTGEIYLVNKYGYMATPSRFLKDAVLRQRIDTEAVRIARLHKSREDISTARKSTYTYPDYRGIQVLGAYEYIPEMEWILIAEIDKSEALRPLDLMRSIFFAILLILPICAWLLGMFIAGFITSPIHSLHKGSEMIGDGNLDYKIDVDTKDEVGQLARAFNSMTENLRKTTTSIDSLNQEISERKKVEAEREIALQWQKDVNSLQQSLLVPAALDSQLNNITDSIVDIFDADFCRIWLIRRGDMCEKGCIHAEVREGPHICRYRDKCLHLVASSGRYTHINGKSHARVPFGCYKIGRVASGEEHKFLTNDAANDPLVHNHEWARELGLVSFAGYQIRIPGGETMGVLALFAKHPVLQAEDAALDTLSTTAAFIIQGSAARESIAKQTQDLNALLNESVKSREILTSMLADNNQVRARLEESLEKLKKAQALLIHAEKMEAIGRMASGIAHEVKNPLGIILQGINYFEMALPPEQKNDREILDMMKDSVKRADKIVHGLLDFSRAEALDRAEQDINTVIESAIDLVMHKLKLSSIEFVGELAKGLPKTSMDVGKMEQVFINLFNNAVDAMPKGGKLYVRSYLSGEEAVIVEVEDTGTGIDEDIIDNIFDPFFTTKNRTEGTGLGLSVTKGIVEMHKGLIRVESKKGKGTKFTIAFEISEERKG